MVLITLARLSQMISYLKVLVISGLFQEAAWVSIASAYLPLTQGASSSVTTMGLLMYLLRPANVTGVLSAQSSALYPAACRTGCLPALTPPTPYPGDGSCFCVQSPQEPPPMCPTPSFFTGQKPFPEPEPCLVWPLGGWSPALLPSLDCLHLCSGAAFGLDPLLSSPRGQEPTKGPVHSPKATPQPHLHLEGYQSPEHANQSARDAGKAGLWGRGSVATW